MLLTHTCHNCLSRRTYAGTITRESAQDVYYGKNKSGDGGSLKKGGAVPATFRGRLKYLWNEAQACSARLKLLFVIKQMDAWSQLSRIVSRSFEVTSHQITRAGVKLKEDLSYMNIQTS